MAELFRYAAFVSYSSRDATFAKRLHRRLESYRVPTSLGKFDLIGGGKKNRIYPVFRDREELAAGPLGEAIEANLRASAALLVVCSQNAAKSPWVEKEIDYFSRIGRSDKIFAIIADTCPVEDKSGNDVTASFLPMAFRGNALKGDALEPLAADARRKKDGFRKACLKVVAGLIGVSPGQLIDREKKRVRARISYSIIGVIAAVAAAAFGISVPVSSQLGTRSNVLAELARSANERSDYESATRYALAGLAGSNWPFVGYDGNAAEAQLRAAILHSQNLFVLRGHSDTVWATIFSPDGRFVVTSSEDGAANVWRSSDGKLITALHHDGPIDHISFSDDGIHLATASGDHTARIWETETGHLIATLRHGSTVREASFSPDGSRVITASWDRTAAVWDASSGKMIGVLQHEGLLGGARYSRNGQLIVTSDDQGANIWDASDFHRVASLTHPEGAVSASFSPDSHHVITAGGDHLARVWSSESGQLLGTFQHDGSVSAASYSPDGKRIVTASEDKVRVWDAESRALQVVITEKSSVSDSQFSPDGMLLVNATGDREVTVWSSWVGQPVAHFVSPISEVLSASFSPDGARVVTGSSDGTARIWAVSPQQTSIVLENAGRVGLSPYSIDGTMLVSIPDKNTAAIWSTSDGKIRAALKHNGAVVSGAFNPDGSRLITASEDHSARVWDAQSGKLLATLRHQGEVWDASFSPDGSRVLTVSEDHSARIWDTSDGKQLLELRHPEVVFAGSFSPNGELIVTSAWDTKTRVWNAKSGELETTIEAASGRAQFSPDNKRLLVGGERARVWDLDTGQVSLTLGEESARDASFSPDGARIITGHEDHAARIWSATTGRLLLTLKDHNAGVSLVSFSHDGKYVVTRSIDVSRVWDAATGQLLTAFVTDLAMFSPHSAQLLTNQARGSTQLWSISALSSTREALVIEACRGLGVRDPKGESALSYFSSAELDVAPALDREIDKDACAPPTPFRRIAGALGVRL